MKAFLLHFAGYTPGRAFDGFEKGSMYGQAYSQAEGSLLAFIIIPTYVQDSRLVYWVIATLAQCAHIPYREDSPALIRSLHPF